MKFFFQRYNMLDMVANDVRILTVKSEISNLEKWPFFCMHGYFNPCLARAKNFGVCA